MALTIRDLTASDEDCWRELWKGYCEFYETDMADDVTNETWQRLLDDGIADMFSLVACDEGGNVIGFTNCVLHPITWSKSPVCYLEDLFVAPDTRNLGAGGALIEAVKKRASAEGWHRIYWKTRNDNDTARSLYDKVADLSEWVVYEMSL
ncbi:MAG: GNAT family N-acetyltransferase [Proteobacteria bacterium]|nr:GNAT family N-acetyltransferase [Pseudomonadota bacterium]